MIRSPGRTTLALGTLAALLLGSTAPLMATETTRNAGSLSGAYLSGRHAEAVADNAAAVNYLNQARGLDPANGRLVEVSYYLAAQIGDFAQAVPAAKRAYETAPRRGLAPVILAVDAYKRKDYAGAWGYIEKIPGQSPNSFALPVLRAWASAPLKPVEAAIGELAPLKNFQDTVRLVEVMSGLLNEFYGRKDQAAAHYDTLAGTIENERISMVRLVVGGYQRLGKTAQAKAVLARYGKAHGPSPMLAVLESGAGGDTPAKITPAEGMAEALYAASELLLQAEPSDARTQIAMAYAQSALYLNPEMTIARRFIGSALTARGRMQEANTILATVKKNDAGYLESQMQIAENLVRLEKTNEALETLRTIVKERPTWPDVHITIGDILRRDKRYVEAVQEYTAALKLYPDKAQETWSLYYTRGIAYERAKDWDAAEKDFRKALELRPNEPSVLNYLGYSYLERRVNLKEARKLIEAAYTKRPDDGYIIDSLGWALFMNGEFDKAVVQLEKAIEAAPADPTINEHLGDVYWKVGRHNEARFQWQRALTLNTEEDLRAALRTKLEQGLAQK